MINLPVTVSFESTLQWLVRKSAAIRSMIFGMQVDGESKFLIDLNNFYDQESEFVDLRNCDCEVDKMTK